MPSPEDTETHMRIRVPDTLRDRLIEIAEKNGRSLNAEVVARLKASLEQNPQSEDASDIKQRVSAIEKELISLRLMQQYAQADDRAIWKKTARNTQQRSEAKESRRAKKPDAE